MRSTMLPQAFRRILLASLSAGTTLGAAGCGAVVAPADGGDVVTQGDASDRRDATDAIVSRDAGRCDPVRSSTTCEATLTWACDPPPGIAPGQTLTQAQCRTYCPTLPGGGESLSCSAHAGAGESVVLRCTYCAIGRRTEGLCEPDLRVPGNVVGQFLANNATLEEASVKAFERLRDELCAHGAPASLLDALGVAADEERDHTERVTRAARAWGVDPQPARVEPVAQRSLFAIALENAVEGCVRETYGALVAAWQAVHAGDPDLASMYARLADDEARHAALSWEMDEWLAPRLSPAERAELERARAEAIKDLFREAGMCPDPALVRVAGLPDASVSRALLEGLQNEIWC